jgi:predicted DNA-binding protein (MmcQ/YjbR family)
LLIELGRAERAPYLHRSWVRIPLGENCPVEQDELADRLAISYDLIRATLPKKMQASLDVRASEP